MLIKVTEDGKPEPYTFESKTRDVVLWEAGGRDRKMDALISPSMTTIYELAFATAKRLALTELSEADFKRQCDVEVVSADGDDLTDPTPATAVQAD